MVSFKNNKGNYITLNEHFNNSGLNEKIEDLPINTDYYYAEASRLLSDSRLHFKFDNMFEFGAKKIVTTSTEFTAHTKPHTKGVDVKDSPERSETKVLGTDKFGQQITTKSYSYLNIERANNLLSVFDTMKKELTLYYKELKKTNSAKSPADYTNVMTSIKNLYNALSNKESSMQDISKNFDLLRYRLSTYEENHRERFVSHGSKATADRYNTIVSMKAMMDSNATIFNKYLKEYAKGKDLITGNENDKELSKKMRNVVISIKDLNKDMEGNAVVATENSQYIRDVKRDALIDRIIICTGHAPTLGFTEEQYKELPFPKNTAKNTANMYLLAKYSKELTAIRKKEASKGEFINKENNYSFTEEMFSDYLELGKKLSLENFNKEFEALSKDKYFKRIVEKTMIKDEPEHNAYVVVDGKIEKKSEIVENAKDKYKLDHNAYVEAWAKIEKESEQLKRKCKEWGGLSKTEYKDPNVARANQLIGEILQDPNNSELLHIIANQSKNGRLHLIDTVAQYLNNTKKLPSNLNNAITKTVKNYFRNEENLSRYELKPNSDYVVRNYDLKEKSRSRDDNDIDKKSEIKTKNKVKRKMDYEYKKAPSKDAESLDKQKRPKI